MNILDMSYCSKVLCIVIIKDSAYCRILVQFKIDGTQL